MRSDKEEAIALRKTGKSYKQIKAEMGVPLSTLSDWLGPLGWSKNIKETLKKNAESVHRMRMVALDRVRGERLREVYASARNEAVEDFERLKYHPLFIAAIMLYWGEGRKAECSMVSITNTDPKMLKLFINFLEHICQIPKHKIRASLLIYPDLSDSECREYWSKEMNLPLENFRKSSIIQGRHKTKRLGHGVGTVYVTSKYLRHKMMVWLELFPETLLTEKYYKPTTRI